MSLDSLTFLFNTYRSFLKVGCPEYSSYEEFMLRKTIFGCYDFLGLKLEDRFLMLRNNLIDDKIKTFLVFLYNSECDFLRTDYLNLSWGHSCLNKEAVFKKILNKHPIDSSIKVFKRILRDVEIESMIGYEKFFFNLKDEFMIFLLKYREFSFDECLDYYDKTSPIINKTKNKLFGLKMVDIIHELYSSTNKKSLKMRLILKLLSHDIVLCDELNYEALFKDEKIYFKVNETLSDDILESILLHEAAHTICRYEEKYIDFLDAYKNEFSKNEITIIWSRAKEVCINQILNYYANNTMFEKLVTKDNYYTLSVVITSLLALKQRRRQKEGLLWK